MKTRYTRATHQRLSQTSVVKKGGVSFVGALGRTLGRAIGHICQKKKKGALNDRWTELIAKVQLAAGKDGKDGKDGKEGKEAQSMKTSRCSRRSVLKTYTQ